MGPRELLLQNQTQAQNAVASKKFVPNANQKAAVEAMSTLGTPIDIIADYVGVSESTVRTAFAEELKHAKLERNLAVVNTLYNRALKGDSKLLMFWARTQLGWKETIVQEHVLPTINIFTIDGSLERTVGFAGEDVITDIDYENVEDSSQGDEDGHG